MESYLESYRKRFGCYPRELLADQIYCTQANRAMLKGKGIKLLAKPLGRPSAMSIHVSPGERNPIEGKFGYAKTGYGLNNHPKGGGFLRYIKPNQSKAQKYKRSVDCRHFFGAELSQIGGGGTPVYYYKVGGKFFSMGERR